MSNYCFCWFTDRLITSSYWQRQNIDDMGLCVHFNLAFLFKWWKSQYKEHANIKHFAVVKSWYLFNASSDRNWKVNLIWTNTSNWTKAKLFFSGFRHHFHWLQSRLNFVSLVALCIVQWLLVWYLRSSGRQECTYQWWVRHAQSSPTRRYVHKSRALHTHNTDLRCTL